MKDEKKVDGRSARQKTIYDDSQLKLINSAIKLLQDPDLDKKKINVSMIAKNAGTSVATAYNHFPNNMVDVYGAIFNSAFQGVERELVEYFKSEGFEITSNSYFDIEADYDIGKVDQNYLYDVLSKIDLNGADALFVSCTALPVLPIIDKLEKKLNTTVLSSNQALIWDTLVQINKNNLVEGFGKLFK